jgi:hypothetical protein
MELAQADPVVHLKAPPDDRLYVIGPELDAQGV